MKIFLQALVSIGCITITSSNLHAAMLDQAEDIRLKEIAASDSRQGEFESLSTPASSLHVLQIEGRNAQQNQRAHDGLKGFYLDVKRPGGSDRMDAQSLRADALSFRLASWLENIEAYEREFALGYRWKRMSIEGSTLHPVPKMIDTRVPQQASSIRSNWHSTRLSFSPAENWLVKLSRGTISKLDNLVPDDPVRRTALTASYSWPFATGSWDATMAWGRNARKNRESYSGYLLESTLRFAGVHSMFGRIEQVGSDSLMRENESLQRQLFKLNRVTFGYYQDIRLDATTGLDVGAFVSRHLIPSDRGATYGSNPTAYMVFLRLKMQ